MLDTDALVQWVAQVGITRWGGLRAASNRTAISKLLSARHDHEPKDLVWFLHNLERLASRLNLAQTSATSYASRARTTIKDFYAAQNEVLVIPRAYEYRELTVREQIADALAALGRWPDLRPYLFHHLVAAIKEIEKWPQPVEPGTPSPPSPKSSNAPTATPPPSKPSPESPDGTPASSATALDDPSPTRSPSVPT